MANRTLGKVETGLTAALTALERNSETKTKPLTIN